MYYEERIIGGVLHWRKIPEGKWIAKTPEQLTSMLIESRNRWISYEPIPYWMNPDFKMPPVTS